MQILAILEGWFHCSSIPFNLCIYSYYNDRGHPLTTYTIRDRKSIACHIHVSVAVNVNDTFLCTCGASGFAGALSNTQALNCGYNYHDDGS